MVKLRSDFGKGTFLITLLVNAMSKEEKKETSIRHSIRFKIFLVSLLPTIALLAAAFLNNQYLNALGYSAEQILSKNYKSIRAAQEARKALEKTRNSLLEIASKGTSGKEPIESIQSLKSNLDQCRDNVTEVGEQELILELGVGPR